MDKVEKKGKFKEGKSLPYFLIAPSLLFMTVFSFFPTFRSFYFSLQNYQRNRPAQRGFIGLENYINLIQDERFLMGLGTSIKWVSWEVALQVLMGLIFALILNVRFRGQGIFRTICFAPWAVSGVLTTMLWILIYNEHIGLLNHFLRLIGFEFLTRAWVQNMSSVFPSIITAELWRGIPFVAISLLAALQSIPDEVYESARVDGANGAQTLFKITLPYLKSTIIFASLMRVIWLFQAVDMIMTMTNGGPMRRTTTVPIYMYQRSIIEGNYGYGSTIAIGGFVFLSVFAILYLKMNNFGKGVNE